MKPLAPKSPTTGAPSRIPSASPTAVPPATTLHTSHSNSIKNWAIGLVVALLWSGGMWGWGYFHGRSNLASQRAGYERRLTNSEINLRSSESQLKQTQDELTQVRYRARLLEARSLLLRAAIDLEKRNFGTANTRLRSASAELKNLPYSDSVNSALVALQREISNTNLVVATDVEQQRTRVLEFGERLDSLTPLASSGSH